MPFKPGHKRIPGSGRRQGTKNKVSIESVKDTLARLEFNGTEYLIREVLPELQPKDQAKLVLNLLEFTDARMKIVEHTGDVPGSGAPIVQVIFPPSTPVISGAQSKLVTPGHTALPQSVIPEPE